MNGEIPKSAWAIGVLAAFAVALMAVSMWEMDRTGEKGSGLGKEFDYNLDKLRKIDPKLIDYVEVEGIDPNFQKVGGITVGSKDRIYVAGDRAVRIFSKAGKRLSELKLAAEPRCLAVAGDGTVYIGMKDHVEVHKASGERKAKWQSLGTKAVVTSIAVSHNNVFVADAGNRVVLRYDTTGRFLMRIGDKDAERNIPGFVIRGAHFDLAMAPDGLLRVANPGRHRIEAYTVDGDLEIWWGKSSMAVEGFCGCCNPVDFALLPDGGFVTSEKWIARVKIYDSDGVFKSVVAGPDAFVVKRKLDEGDDSSGDDMDSLDLTVDSQGRVLVLDPRRRIVRIFVKKVVKKTGSDACSGG